MVNVLEKNVKILLLVIMWTMIAVPIVWAGYEVNTPEMVRIPFAKQIEAAVPTENIQGRLEVIGQARRAAAQPNNCHQCNCIDLSEIEASSAEEFLCRFRAGQGDKAFIYFEKVPNLPNRDGILLPVEGVVKVYVAVIFEPCDNVDGIMNLVYRERYEKQGFVVALYNEDFVLFREDARMAAIVGTVTLCFGSAGGMLASARAFPPKKWD